MDGSMDGSRDDDTKYSTTIILLFVTFERGVPASVLGREMGSGGVGVCLCIHSKGEKNRKKARKKERQRRQAGRQAGRSNSIRSCSVQFSSIQFSSVQFSSVQFSSVQFSSINFGAPTPSLPKIRPMCTSFL
jgi:hypothetical protein